MVVDGAAERAWHPVALARELRPGGWLQVRLLGRTWSLHRDERGLTAAPPAFDVGERYGLVWLAPAEPRGRPLRVPEAEDRRFAAGSLAPVRLAGAAPEVLDRLAPEHGPDVVRSPSGWTRRVTDPGSGARATVVVVLQPEDDDSTRAFGLVLLSSGPGRPLPSPAAVAGAVAAEQRALAAA